MAIGSGGYSASQFFLPRPRYGIVIVLLLFMTSITCELDDAETGEQETRKKVLVFGGVMTSFGYSERREWLRSTWFPSTQAKLDELERNSSFVLRFIIGTTDKVSARIELAAEIRRHGGFMRLPNKEEYRSLSFKSHAFFREVMRQYDPMYVLKLDDDVYLQVDRVPVAVQQWNRYDQDYIGCFYTNSEVYTNPNNKWAEPQQALFPGRYHAYAQGTLYALSNKALKLILALPDDSKLRYFISEDVTLGVWMLVLDVNHYEDMRLCADQCTKKSIAIRSLSCAGLCHPREDLFRLHANESCTTPFKGDWKTFPGGRKYNRFARLRRAFRKRKKTLRIKAHGSLTQTKEKATEVPQPEHDEKRNETMEAT